MNQPEIGKFVEIKSKTWSRIDAGTRTGNMEIRWQGISKQAVGAGTVAESGTAGASFNVLSTSGDITFA